MAQRAFLGLGSNQGSRVEMLRSACQDLDRETGIELEGCSHIYETTPVGAADQLFLNAVIQCKSLLSPQELLSILLNIEHSHGRLRRERWGNRVLDIDLLYVEGDDGDPVNLETKNLRLPHPEMCNRDFVLLPLSELAPSLRISDKTVLEHLEAIKGDDRSVKGQRPEKLLL